MNYVHPGYKKPYPIATVLRDLASQEGCDGEPYDVMIAAAGEIARLTADLATSRAETAMAFEVSARDIDCGCRDGVCAFEHACPKSDVDAIRALTPTDATAALAARDKAKDDRIAELEAAATNAKMYLESGFINCPRCAEEVATKDTDAEYALRDALADPQSEVSHG